MHNSKYYSSSLEPGYNTDLESTVKSVLQQNIVTMKVLQVQHQKEPCGVDVQFGSVG